MTILEGIPMGEFYFSSMLCNSEAWYAVSKAELDLLETIDVQFLRQILRSPKTTPKEMLFLELGCIPLRELIRKRRILFLQYIVKESPQSMMYTFLEAQLKNRKDKDWISLVLRDIQELKLNLELEDLKKMKNSKLKLILNKAVKENAFKELEIKKESHSKVKHLKHFKLEMQNYLKPNKLKINQE